MVYEILKGNVVIADKVRHYKDFMCKTRGLMFTKPLKKGSAIILESANEGILDTTIHMLFVFYPIDIVWLNSSKKVVDIRKSVLPFIPWINPRKPAKYVVELARGASKGINVGDVLEFKKR